MTLLITRPRVDAEAFAAALAKRGIASMVEPLSEIEYLNTHTLPTPPPVGEEIAIITTSRHALMHPDAASIPRDVPLYVVGEASAALATSLGFSNVHMAGENVEELADDIRRHCEEAEGRRGNPSLPAPGDGLLRPKGLAMTLMYLRGEHVSHDLKALLPECKIEERVLYTSKLTPELSAACIHALQKKQLSGVAFFSSRHAQHFATLCAQHHLAPYADLTAYCMSETIAAAIQKYPWKKIVISPSQNASAMVDNIGMTETPEPPQIAAPKAAPSPFVQVKRAFFIMFVVLGVVYFSNIFIAPRTPMPLAPAPVAGQVPPPPAPPPAPVADVALTPPSTPPMPPPEPERVHDLEERLSSLEARLKEQADMEEYASRKAEGALKVVAYWQAYDDLKTTLFNGGNYSQPLQHFRTLAQGNAELLRALEPLTAAQEQGVATPEQLKGVFKEGVRLTLQQAPMNGEQTTFASIRHNVRGLVTIRNMDVEGTSIDATLARAEAALKANQLTECLKALETLPVEAQETMHAFTLEARARAAALAQLTAIRALLAPQKREED